MALFYTADTFANVDAVYLMSFNQADWFRQAIESALVLLTDPNNWQQVGAITVDEAAAAASEAYYNWRPMYDTTGTIIPYAYLSANLPPGLLACDGALYDTTDYPVLFGRVGYTFGGSGSQFGVPDLRGRTVISSGTGTGLTPRGLGDLGGEETHVLTVPELATHTHTNTPHSHGVTVAAPNATTVGPGAPQPTAIPFPGVTSPSGVIIDNTGSDTAHNNMQPFLTLGYAIVTGQ